MSNDNKRLSEEAILRSTMFSEATESLTDGLMIYDKDSYIIEFNSAFKSIMDLMHIKCSVGVTRCEYIKELVSAGALSAGDTALEPWLDDYVSKLDLQAVQEDNISSEDVTTMLSNAAAEKNLDLLVRMQPNLPSTYIGDVGRLRQIMTNLVGNALKFTHFGHVLVDISGQENGANFDLVIRVADTGIGIPQDQVGDVFQKFRQTAGGLDVLIAEDNETNQVYIKYVMEDLGLSFKIVPNGRAAVDYWRSENPSIILMDISMPELNGYEATKLIRADEVKFNKPHTPIIDVTAHTLSGDEARCRAAGVDDYLSKPVSIEGARSKIEQWSASTQLKTA